MSSCGLRCLRGAVVPVLSQWGVGGVAESALGQGVVPWKRQTFPLSHHMFPNVVASHTLRVRGLLQLPRARRLGTVRDTGLCLAAVPRGGATDRGHFETPAL